jgi:long-chain fatty acid transport protein
MPSPRWRVGIGVSVPFGLKTEYENGWLGRYQALKSEVKTININPAFAWKATRDFWLGAGANYQQFKATLTNNVNYTGALAQGYQQAAAGGVIPPSAIPALIGATSGLDSFVSTTGDDWSWGWNVGAMYSIGGSANDDNGAARLGAAYRSKIKFNVTGNVGITNPTPPTLSGALAPFNPVVQGVSNTINQTRLYNGGVALDVTVPDSASFSYYQRLNDIGTSSPTSRGRAGAASRASRSRALPASRPDLPPCFRSITRTRGGCRGA